VLQEGGLNCVTGLGKYQGRLIMLLDTSKILEFGSPQKASSEGKAGATKTEGRGAAAAR
jgi:chemotaxis signal transduction protein